MWRIILIGAVSVNACETTIRCGDIQVCRGVVKRRLKGCERESKLLDMRSCECVVNCGEPVSYCDNGLVWDSTQCSCVKLTPPCTPETCPLDHTWSDCKCVSQITPEYIYQKKVEFRAKQAAHRMYEELRRRARELVYVSTEKERKDVAERIYAEFEE